MTVSLQGSLLSHAKAAVSSIIASVMIVAPMASFAVSSDILTAGDNEVVTRGDFIRASMKAMGVNLMTDRKKLPYTRIPEALQPYVQTAYELDALKAFGTNLAPAKAITRGEALQVVVGIEALLRAKVTPVTFTDVKKSTPLGRAVALAIERNWMKPQSQNTFGVAATLKGKEARELLQAVTGQALPAADAKGVKVQTQKSTTTTSLPLKYAIPKQDDMQAVWELLNRDYLYKDRVNADEAGFKSIQGLVQSLNDPYTTFLPPASAQNFQSQLAGEVTGIGAQVEQVNGVVKIIAPLPGSPAEKAGIQAGDDILAADDVSLAGLTLDDAVNKIRGVKGTQVKLHIRRGTTEMDITVVRDQIKTLEIQVTDKNGVAYVRLLQFGMTADQDLRGIMQKVQDTHPRGVILDLRNNPGGLLHAAEIVASVFLPKGSTFITMESKGNIETDVTHDEPVISATTPLVVLINKGSASASEVVAAALRDAGRAKLIGETTYGKGTVQEVYKFKDGSSFKMTIAEWKSPKGTKIDKVGVTPDIEVVKDMSSTGDNQLDRALSEIR